MSVFVDLRRSVPGFAPSTVFDVGANVGQSTRKYLQVWPRAHVYSFEPVPETYAALSAAVRPFGDRVECHQLAFGSRPGQLPMAVNGTETGATLRTDAKVEYTDRVTVHVATLDEWCRDNAVSGIGYLKIDTEGHDLGVLEGAAGLLEASAAEVIEVEAGMHPDNDLHVPLEDLKGHLESKGYRLAGIYEQVTEWTKGEPYLRRVDAVFFAPRLAHRQL